MMALIFLAIFLSTFFGAWYILNGSLIFHTDIARDFLLIEDIVKVKPLTLIGPRSGGIPGVFHGPVWLYLNVPAFILGRGNPVVVGWFWVILFIATLFLIYKLAMVFFNDKYVAAFAVALFASCNIATVSQLFNPYGALMLSVIFFYFYWQYTKNSRWINLLIALFILGFVIQFQMAFGGPILILTLISTIYLIFKNKDKKFSHLLTFFILLIPLSTFILFDLKHQFLQFKAVISFLGGGEAGSKSFDFLGTVDDRVRRFFFEGPKIVIGGKWIMLMAFLYISYAALTKIFKGRGKEKNIYSLFLYFYGGFWLLTIPFSGEIWSYYYWPFAPLLAIIFASFYLYVDKKLFTAIVFIALFFNILSGAQTMFKPAQTFVQDGGSWKFYHQVAEKVYQDAGGEFGYYIFSPELFGYSSRYGMNYTQNQFPKNKAYPFEKKRITYLLMSPSDNPFANASSWRQYKVKIDKKPAATFSYKQGFVIEKYILTDEEIAVASDPLLIHDLMFR